MPEPRLLNAINWRTGLVVFCVILIVSQSVKSNPHSDLTICEGKLEACIYDAIMGNEFKEAQLLIDQLSQHPVTDPLIGEAKFYQGVLNWQKNQRNNAQPYRYTKLLTDAIDRLAKRKNSSAQALLAYALACAHSARIFLFEEQHYRTSKYGKRALKALKDYLEHSENTASGREASHLLIALVAIHQEVAPKWAKNYIKRFVTLSPSQARYQIAAVARSDSPFAHQAQRILLLELPWSRQHICQYRAQAKQLTDNHPKNPHYSLMRQGLDLLCGYPYSALAENQRAGQRFKPHPFPELQLKAKLRALADSADVDGLNAIKIDILPDSEMYYHWQIAQADALSRLEQDDKATKLYQQMLVQEDLNHALRILLQKRLKYPYRRSTAFPVTP